MDRLVQIACIVLVAIAMALTLAHALELPGKMRLGKDAYLSVQQIYYPGFTVGGIAEPLGILALLALLVFMPPPGTRFWWTLAAFVSLIAMHLVYWFVTHPTNNFWTKNIQLSGFGATFFSLFAPDISGSDWTKLRDVWEYSHVARRARHAQPDFPDCRVRGLTQGDAARLFATQSDQSAKAASAFATSELDVTWTA